MPVYLRALDRSAMLLQELLRARLGVERLRLDPPGRRPRAAAGGPHRGRPGGGDAGQAAAQPGAAAGARLAGRQRARRASRTRADLSAQPRAAPGLALAGDTAARRPARRRAAGSDPGRDRWTTPRSRPSSPTPRPAFAALQAVAARHQSALDRMRNTRQMMFRSNFGICRFEHGRGRRGDRRQRGVHLGRRPRDPAAGARPVHGPPGAARSASRSRRRAAARVRASSGCPIPEPQP